MKVIAKIDSERVLCEVSTDEIALLNGFRSRYDEGCNINFFTNVGAECRLSNMANISHYIRTMNEQVLTDAKKKLKNAIKIIEDAEEEVTKLTIFETIKD